MRFLLMLAATGFLLAACADDEQDSNAGPSPTSSPTRASPTLEPTTSPVRDRLAYVDAAGDIWLTTPDGGERTKLIQADRCPHPRLIWSPAGDRIACVGLSRLVVVKLDGRPLLDIDNAAGLSWSADGEYMLYGVSTLASPPSPDAPAVFDQTLYFADADGSEVDSIDGAAGGVWSPDGSRFAYRAHSGDAVIYTIAGHERRSLGVSVDSLGPWVLDGDAILAFTNERDCGLTCLSDTNILDPGSGTLTRLPELDNISFEPFPDGSKVITLSFRQDPSMAILDLATRESTPIDGASISYPSEGIPDHHLVVTPDGSEIYWATVLPFDGTNPRVQIFRARSDGSGVTEIATIPALQVWFSPDFTKVAYAGSGILYVADIDGSNAVEIGPSNMPCCSGFPWQPQS